MNIIHNHNIFSHAFLARLQTQDAHKVLVTTFVQRQRDWLPYRDSSSLLALVGTWISQALGFLDFHETQGQANPHIQHLYVDWGAGEPIGPCYTFVPGQDLDETIDGHHPMTQAVLALRSRNLRRGCCMPRRCSVTKLILM